MNCREDYKNANINKYNNSIQKNKVLGKEVSLSIFRNAVPRLFKKGDRVLDIAGGVGVQTDILRELGITDDIYAIDISKDSINERNKNDKSIVGDMENLPYEDGYFDKALFIAAIHHTNKTIKAISEAKRVLKKDGGIIFYEPISIRLLLKGKDIEPTPDGVEFVLSVRYLLRCLNDLELKVSYIRFYGYLTRFLGRKFKKMNILFFKIENFINYIPGLRYVLGLLGNRVIIAVKKID